MTLTEFLLARIEDDEAATLILDCRCGPGAAEVDPLPDCPDRVLADCVAKRRLLDWAAPVLTSWPDVPEGFRYVSDDGRDVLCILAAPYADHPDYREEWRP